MAAPSARAQVAEPRKSVDVSGFAGVAGYGRDIELGNSWAAEQIPGTGVVLGGRVGLTLLPDLAPASALDPQLGVEGELGLAFSSTGESMDGGRRSFFSPVFGWRIHGIARLRTTGKVHPHLVVGVGGETVWTGSPFMADDTDAAFHWGLGLTWNASPSWIARLDLRHGVTAGRTSYLVNTFELQLGIEKSFGFGGGHETVAKRPDPEPDPEPKPIPDPDLDKDGIVNEQDQCPTDPEDADGFEDDNGCPDPDNDQDQILDAVDQCPVEAEDVDQFEDEDGCPELDNDGDSIPDDMDPCPLEPENVNGFEDSNGCPDVLPDIVKKYTGVISGITFAYSRAGIKKSSKKVLNKAAAVLREYPDLRIRIEGHTDPKGKRDKNVSLSLRRAETVKWYLVDQGIEASRIETVGWGPDHPMASNKTAKGRAKNRRIEFHLIVTEPPAAPEPAPAPEPTPPTEPGL